MNHFISVFSFKVVAIYLALSNMYLAYLISDIKINLILLQQKQQHKNNRGSFMSAHVLFNVFNNHGDQIRGFFQAFVAFI